MVMMPSPLTPGSDEECRGQASVVAGQPVICPEATRRAGQMTVTAIPTQGQGPRQDNLAGILCIIAGVAVFFLQDLVLKFISGGYPLHQAMVIRSLAATPFLAFLVWRQGGTQTLRTPGWRMMIGRGVVMFLAYATYYLALAGLPLATVVAIFFASPLFITILSVLVLGERVGWHRWAAVAAGFAGVVILVRPGGNLFDWAAVLPVMAALFYAWGMIVTRKHGGTETAAAMALYGNFVFLVLALCLAALFGGGQFASEEHKSIAFLLRGWVWPTALDLALMLACGPIAAAGLTLLAQGYRIAASNVVTPFEYTAMIWGVLFGWLIWRDLPDRNGWLGIAIILCAGLYVLWREGRNPRAPATPHP